MAAVAQGVLTYWRGRKLQEKILEDATRPTFSMGLGHAYFKNSYICCHASCAQPTVDLEVSGNRLQQQFLFAVVKQAEGTPILVAEPYQKEGPSSSPIHRKGRDLVPNILAILPWYYDEVVRRLIASNWLCHSFEDADLRDLFRPENYLDRQYVATIDLNIFQYIVNSAKKDSPKEEYRNACAMLIFCRFARIQIEPSLALHEHINNQTRTPEEALFNLSIFRALDDSSPDQLAEYMLGETSRVAVTPSHLLDSIAITEGLTRWNRLQDWDDIYALILSAVHTYFNRDIEPTRKLEYYLDWMIRRFRLSQPCVLYAIRLFGVTPLRGMMKFKESQIAIQRRRALWNMTWDLYIIHKYLSNWCNPACRQEEIVFTQDKVLRELLGMATAVMRAQDIEPLLVYLRPGEKDSCAALLKGASTRRDRIYGTDAWSRGYRDELVAKLEGELGVQSC